MVTRIAKRKVAKKRVVSSKATPKNRIKDQGNGEAEPVSEMKTITIPALKIAETVITIEGINPLLMNNKMGIAPLIAEEYGLGGKTKGTGRLKKLTPDEMYAFAFYTLPDTKHDPPSPKGRYGVPASGIKKCICSGIRTAGFTNNTDIGLIGKSFWIMSDCGGLCLLNFKKLEKDIRPVNIGSGQKTVPAMRQRPMFHGWSCDLLVRYNPGVLGPESLINLFMHAGQYIGLCEMRAEKKQGECGGFAVANY